ncbi:MAG: endolytic transglycosylase MltG [Rikenellaceae bacterium]|nr:endolytic transglycosylase MltG [Rikenellaceae bacterium]
MKSKTKKIIAAVAASLALIAAACAVAGYTLWKGNAVARSGELYIERGTSSDELTEILRSEGYLKNIGRFRRFSGFLGFDGQPRAGHYVLKPGMSYPQVVRMFQGGLQTPVKVTFNNIRSLDQLAGRVSRQLEPDSLSFYQVFHADTTALYYGFRREDFISMFIPDTYQMYWTSSPQAFLDRMKREFDNFWNEGREDMREAMGLSRSEVITLASIVYEETKMSDEMARVAGVYMNRLRRGIKLQADPTVKYAVGDFTLRRILFRHLEVDSPYNTYLYEGLPPGPISMPSVTAIDAVLNYEEHDYLYFCAKSDFSGYHAFARTLAEHNRNRDLWVAALNRAGIK